MEQDRYSCIVSAIIDMQERGFDVDFNLSGGRLLCSQLAMLVGSEDFEVVEMHYFPRSRETAWEKMVYGIEVPSCGLRGILISGTNQLTAFPEVITMKLRGYTSRRRIIHSRLL